MSNVARVAGVVAVALALSVCSSVPGSGEAATGEAAGVSEKDTAGEGAPLGALAEWLGAGAVIFLGEVHGTAEAPELVGRVVELARRRGLPVTVALEIFGTESGRVDAYLASDGGEAARQALLAGHFWQRSYQDGRASEAMLDLIEELRGRIAAGEPIRVVCFDRPVGPGFERERAMAEALAAALAAAPETVTVVLTGNIHARLARGAGRGISEPMALQVAELLPDRPVLSLRLAHSGGTTWMCGPGVPGGCGIVRLKGSDGNSTPRVVFDDALGRGGFHGDAYLGEIHASLPAVGAFGASVAPAPLAPAPLEAVAAAVSPAPLSPVPLVGDWPQWMGPRRDGSLEPGLAPLGATVRLETDWRRPVGGGESSIVVAGRRGLTLESDERNVWAVAFDVTDGGELWRTALGAPVPAGSRPPLQPLSTPAIGGDRVFAIRAEGRLFALDAADGAILWQRDLVDDFGASPPSYGMSTSPVLEGGRLFVLVGGREGHNLVAFDPASGEVLGSVGPALKASYATPAVGVLGGRRQLVVPAADRLYGLSLDGHAPLWSHAGIAYPDRPPLLLPGGRVFLAFQEHGAMFEVAAEPWAVRELWRAEPLNNSYSPTVHRDGSLYGMGNGRLMCLDAGTGAIRWQQRLGMGSLLRVDDQLAVFGSLSGTLRLVAAVPEGYSETARLQVFPAGQHGSAAPSFGAGRIFVRGGAEIAAVRLDPGTGH